MSFAIPRGRPQTITNTSKLRYGAIMNIILFGPPGAGKGTQSERIIEHYSLAHLSTGNMFRSAIQNKTPLGLKVSSILASGELVSDDIVVALVQEETEKEIYHNGCIYDGFPRTVAQSAAFDQMLSERNQQVDFLLSLTVDNDELVNRILSRGQGRSDDTEEGIKHRLNVYNNETKPVLNYYNEKGLVIEVDGTGSVDDVFNRIKDAIDAI